jgi:hypothetical protein
MQSTTNSPTSAPDERLADLTRRYARYSISAGGLASVLGGLLALVAYLLGAVAPPDGLLGRGALALTPFVWIAAKEALRRGYYQRLGRVVEARTRSERRWHLGFTAFTALVSASIVGVILWLRLFSDAGAFGWGIIGYLALVATMPVLVWYFMKTPLEFIVGVFLVCQAALMLVGMSYSLWQQPQAPIAAVALMVVGVRQHRDFRRLRRELADLRPAPTAP